MSLRTSLAVQWLRLHLPKTQRLHLPVHWVRIWSLVRELKEKTMAPHSTTLSWKIPWMEEPGGLQSMRSLRVGHDWVISLSLFTFMHWRRKWQPTPVFLPGESRDGGAWWAAVYGVTQSQTGLQWLSSSSREAKSLHVSGPQKQNKNVSNIVTNSIKPLKMVHIKKKS